MFSNITRGGQLLSHHVVMWIQVMKRGFRFGLVFCIAMFGLYVYMKVPNQVWREAWVWRKAKFYYDPSKDQRKVTVSGTRASDGKVFHIPVPIAYKHPKIRQSYIDVWTAIYSGAWFSLINIFILFGGTILVYELYGRKQKQSKHIRGNELVDTSVLKRALVKKIGMIAAFRSIKWTRDRLPLPAKYLVKNTMIVGTTGSGKTVALTEIMAQVQKMGHKAIVYDVKGAFIEKFYREGKDIILNPLDLRFPNWNLWSECKVPADFDRIAATMMPEHIATSDPFWIKSARTIFSAAARQLQQKKCFDTRELLKQIFNDASDEDQLVELLKGTEAESLVSKDIKQVALSIKATLTNYCKALMYLPAYDEAKKDFSITEWLQDENNSDSWIFISVVDDGQHEALKPLISIWADIAFQAILRLKRDRNRRIFSFIDELPSLQRLSSLERLLSLGREYGNSFYTTVQDINQFKTIYGNQASTLLGLMNTKLFMAVESPEAAEWMSKALFNKEYLESREGRSYGANTIRDGVNISKDKRNERIVTPGEIAGLDELEGYLKFPGNLPVAKVYFTPYDYKEVAPDLEPRDISSADFDLSKVMPIEKEKKPRKPRKDKGRKKNNDLEQKEGNSETQLTVTLDDGHNVSVKENIDDVDEHSNADANSVDIKEQQPKEFKTVIGNITSSLFKKNDVKRTMFFSANLAENSSSCDEAGYTSETTTWYKLLFFGELAEDALKKITKGCRVEVIGEYKEVEDINEKTGEETTKFEIIVKKFKVLSSARNKEKPKIDELQSAKIYQASKDLKRDEYVYEMDSPSINR